MCLLPLPLDQLFLQNGRNIVLVPSCHYHQQACWMKSFPSSL